MPFPATDFNFVVAGIATFAATFGYAYTRRLSATSTPASLTSVQQQEATESETMDIDHDLNDGIAGATVKMQSPAAHESTISTIDIPSNARRESLKRKVPHDGFDDPGAREPLGYPHNLANIYPRKRSKTPSLHSVESDVQGQVSSGLPTLTTSVVVSLADQDVKPVIGVGEVLPTLISIPPLSISGTNAATPATEPPLSPSPIPEHDGELQAQITIPQVPRPSNLTPPPENREITTVVQSTNVEEVTTATPVHVIRSSDASPLSVDNTLKLPTHPAFGITSTPKPFSISRPSTPIGAKSQTLSNNMSPNPFAAFSGSSSPYTSSAFGRGSTFSSSSFGSASLFGSSFTSSTSSAAGAFDHSGSINNKNLFTVTPVWKLKPGSMAQSIFSQEIVSRSALTSEKKDEDGNEDAETEEVRLARERREREEAEIRAQEAREKQLRKERRTRERATGHVLLEAPIPTENTEEKYTPVTGEEDEDVELEQRNIRLFVKRGDRAFSEPIPGHIKLLANRRTLEERILVRREPLWKVSMNVRVQPTVRATYVTSEHGDHVLRFIVKEPTQTGGDDAPMSSIEGTDATPQYELVIYVVKPGKKCPKKDFQEFAESLVETMKASASSKAQGP